MKISLGNTIRCAAGVLTLAVSLAGTALPAQASSTKLFVDNTGRCKNAHTTIQDAINALGPNPTGTITVCAGTYTAGGAISGANKLKLIAKKGVLIAPAPGFTGTLFSVQNSTNVTIQGFGITGGSALATSGENIAIQFLTSSGTITRNTITGWREANLAAATGNDWVMDVENATATATQVNVTRNSINDWQSYAISMQGASVVATVSGNKLFATSVSNLQPYGIALFSIPTGKVTGNTITSDFVPGVSTTSGIAIYGANSSFLKISANKVSHWANGIGVFAGCFTPSTPVGAAANNSVTGNRIAEVGTGIILESDANSPGACTSNAYNAKISGNKITNIVGLGSTGIQVVTQQSGAGTALAQNESVKGNTIKHFSYSTNGGVRLMTIGGAQSPLGIFAPNHFIP
jgi:hypothetical protein